MLFLIFESDVDASFECGFGDIPICLTAFKIRIYSIVKVCKKLNGGGSLVGDEGSDSLHLSVKDAIRFRKLNASDIAFVFSYFTSEPNDDTIVVQNVRF